MRRDAGGFIIIIIILCFLYLLVALPSTSSLPCHPDQRHDLLHFKQSLYITGPIIASWMEDEDCCSWDGITCDNSTGDVVGLDLTCARLSGFINSSSPLFSLRHIRHLSLAGNDLLGSAIPPEIGVFTQLTCLNLSYSNIFGILPTEISLLWKMVSLDLSDNVGLEIQDHTMRMLVQNLTQLEELNLGYYVNMSKVTPTSFLNLSSSLISLNLSDCWLSGNFPEFIFGLPNLQVIDISGNVHLTGTLPKSKWSPSLDYLSLFGCSFTGAVPNSIGNLSRLTHMDLSGNNLTGAVPNSIGNLSRLTYLDLLGNNFTGAVPNSIGNLSRLTHLDLSGNNLMGAVPNSIGNLSRLTYLVLSGNNFTIDLGILSTLEDLQFLDLSALSILGKDANHEFSLPKLQQLIMGSCNLSKFPSFLAHSKELRILYLSKNRIQEIPSWLWSIGIDALEILNLDYNLIKGSIPQCLGNLTKLHELSLSNNLLSGPLPTSLANCTSLMILNVSYNNINGAPPTSLPVSSISIIDLWANNFVGQWPPDIFLLSAFFFYIDLSDNKFEGPLPVPTTTTVYYSVSNNHFSGSLSSLLCNATDLQLLDLSNNSLTGVLPDCLEKVTRGLVILNLRANEFLGQISEIFHEGSMLTSLDLSRNQFEGPLPRSLSHCKQLEVLEVGNNKIEDSFPNWLGDLPLKVLSLRSNCFRGHVNIAGGTHPFIVARIIDLSRNNFDGNLPDEFISKMFDMTRDDNYHLGNQYMRSNDGILKYYSVMIDLKGIEIEMVKINVQFAMLDLSSNHFHGEIPKSIGLLKLLKGLNFSHNSFTGAIPPSVGNMTNLESLDLSSNHLMGEIPKELVKLTFLGFLDLSSNNLTGPIPLGGHIDTFPNSSFKGNPGLCGIPLTRSCGQGVQPPSEGKDGGEDGGGWLEWKYVVLGFGSGIGMGISLGYMVLEMGRPLWLVRLVMRLEASYRKMSKRKKGDQRRNGQR